MLALSDVLHLLANELSRLGARGLALLLVAARPLNGAFLRHSRTLLLLTTENMAQLALGALQNILAMRTQTRATAVDIEIEHRHRGLIRRALAPAAGLGGMLQRLGDVLRTG